MINMQTAPRKIVAPSGDGLENADPGSAPVKAHA
jgi:hypothetical protein